MMFLRLIDRGRGNRRSPLSRRQPRLRIRALRLEVLETRTLLNADPGRLVLTLNPVPFPQPDLAGIVASYVPGVTFQSTTIPNTDQVLGTPTQIQQLQNDLKALQWISAEEGQTETITLDPNDPFYQAGDMWGMNGTFGINAPTAWNVTTGSPKTVIASIDTGVDYDHPDLYQNIWINQPEIPLSRMKNLVDVFHDGFISWRDLNNPINIGPGKITDVNGDGVIDAGDILSPMILDANGNDTGMGGWANPNNVQDGDTTHPDDLIGWNFVNNTNNPLDDNGHGTHTSGTMAAMGNNGVGVVGVNWTAQIMPLKFIAANGVGSDMEAGEAIMYAANHGAMVSNNSYGDTAPSTAIQTAIQYAQSKGDIFVAAAGNDSTNNDTSPFYPAAYSLTLNNVVAVAAIDSTGALASFSDFGASSVALGAPGVNILSTTPNDTFSYDSGTSMASPHVAGSLALLESAHPTWTYTQLINQILSTVTPDPSLAGKTVTGGILNIGAALSSAATASFVSSDTSTQGTWKGVYGSDGFDISQDSSSLPSYAAVSLIGANNNIWANDTQDPRALQKGSATATDRIAACWYGQRFTIDVNLTDGQTHAVSLYADDWDSTTRAERIDVIDPSTGNVLDSRTISSFSNGEYLTWNIKGHVQFRVTSTGSPNAVIGGIFFGTPNSSSGAATFVSSDATTQGTWKGVYGSDGFDISQDLSSLPSYATVALNGQSNNIWANDTQDPRALQKGSPSATDRIAASWYGQQFTIDVNLTDGQTHDVSLYADDWDSTTRAETIKVIDPSTGNVLDSRSISSFSNGIWLTWALKGHVQLQVTSTGSPNAVIGGIFFGTPTMSSTSASFLGSDTTTEGSWKGVYGSDGFDISQDLASVPSYATLALNGISNNVWASDTQDPRALQKGSPSATDRIAACWYGQQFTIDLNLTDGQTHDVSIYADDWDSTTRAETINVIDPSTGTVLDSRTISSFSNGVYLSWALKGHVQIQVVNTGSPNAVIGGIFFGPKAR